MEQARKCFTYGRGFTQATSVLSVSTGEQYVPLVMLAQLELHAVEGTSVCGAHFFHRRLVLEGRGQQVFQVG